MHPPILTHTDLSLHFTADDKCQYVGRSPAQLKRFSIGEVFLRQVLGELPQFTLGQGTQCRNQPQIGSLA
jgi:hypothetical protein